ncbi:MAG: esterase/lipase family protein [Hyphomicrobiales bacterium]
MTDQIASQTLVFVVHGLRGNKEKLGDLKRLLEEAYPGCNLKLPEFSYASLLSTKRAPQLVQHIISLIDDAYSMGNFDRVVLVGHSMGAVLARRALIEASGVPSDWVESCPHSSKLEKDLAGIKERKWAAKVERFVMLASISRGWSAQHTKSPLQSFQWNLGGMIGHLLPQNRRPTLFDFRQGSPFIVQTRLRWLDYCRHVQDRPQVIQFLGTKDDVAPPNDSVDFATSQETDRFIQVELPHSSHSSLLQFYPKTSTNPSNSSHMKTRLRIVKAVLQGQFEAYEKYVVKRQWFSDELPPPPDSTVKNVVFVLHGIRDRGFWTKKIAARVREKADDASISLISRTPSYGYFPILPFLLPWYRRQKVEWFMDHYVEAAAVYYDADMHFLGHSNGTYLAARALQDYPIVSFKRIFFAGSVVRTDYEWDKLVASGRVEKIFNVVATADWVVAIFPNGLRFLQSFFDLGGAGHVGFEKSVPGALYQMDHPASSSGERDYVDGGHSAGRAETLWNEIAEFFVYGDEIPVMDNPNFKTNQPLLWRIIGYISPAIVACIATIVIGLGVISLWATTSSIASIDPPAWTTDGWLWNAWFNVSTPGHLLILSIYTAVLRFMALRF